MRKVERSEIEDTMREMDRQFDRAFRFVYPTVPERNWVAFRFLQRKHRPGLKRIEHNFELFKIRSG